MFDGDDIDDWKHDALSSSPSTANRIPLKTSGVVARRSSKEAGSDTALSAHNDSDSESGLQQPQHTSAYRITVQDMSTTSSTTPTSNSANNSNSKLFTTTNTTASTDIRRVDPPAEIDDFLSEFEQDVVLAEPTTHFESVSTPTQQTQSHTPKTPPLNQQRSTTVVANSTVSAPVNEQR